MVQRQGAMEGVEVNSAFWRGRRVFLTGHTGFKGSWLALWLQHAGAEVTGFALDPPTSPSLFEAASVAAGMTSIRGDVRDLDAVRAAMAASRPQVVIHMAAQSLVRPSYDDPVGTYTTNVIGTVHVLEAVRSTEGIEVAVVVTSDKCYENREWVWPYREDEPMGGREPYSSSKACAELVTAAYRRSFFTGSGASAILTVRAGNVIGGGDWAKDRLVPDLVRAFTASEPALIRNPAATRPWQFVLDPLNGYLQLVEAAAGNADLPHAWNFGPAAEGVQPVHRIADAMVSAWGDGAAWRRTDGGSQPHEAHALTLDSARARALIGWRPRLDAGEAIRWTTAWYKRFVDDPGAARAATLAQIEAFDSLTTPEFI